MWPICTQLDMLTYSTNLHVQKANIVDQNTTNQLPHPSPKQSNVSFFSPDIELSFNSLLKLLEF